MTEATMFFSGDPSAPPPTMGHLGGRSNKERGYKLLLEQTCEEWRWCQCLHLQNTSAKKILVEQLEQEISKRNRNQKYLK